MRGFYFLHIVTIIFFIKFLTSVILMKFRVVEVNIYLLAKKVECIFRCYFVIFILFIFKPLFKFISHFLIELFSLLNFFEFFVYYRNFFSLSDVWLKKIISHSGLSSHLKNVSFCYTEGF